jgi:hypothetical protein
MWQVGRVVLMIEYLYNEDSPVVQCIDNHIQMIKATIYEANYKIDEYISEDRAIIAELENLRSRILTLS